MTLDHLGPYLRAFEMISNPLDAPTYTATVSTSRRQPTLAARLDAGLRAIRDPDTITPAPVLAPTEPSESSLVGDQDWPSLNVVAAELREMIDSQNERLRIIDTKANFGLAAASLLTAGVTGLGSALTQSSATEPDPAWHVFGGTITANGLTDAVTIIALGTFALIALLTYLGYRIQAFREVANPGRLVDVYVHKPEAETTAALTKQRAKNFDHNEATLERKATLINGAMVLLVVQAALLMVIAVIQAVWL